MNVNCGEAVSISPVGPITAGEPGASVLTRNVRASDGALVLPAASVAVAVTECEPSASVTVFDHVPPVAVTLVPSDVVASKSSTLAPSSAVPLIVTLWLLSEAPASGLLITGLPGAAVSILTVRLVPPLVFPAASVAVAV